MNVKEDRTIKQTEDEIVADFSLFGDWEDKYEYIIEFGKNLPTMDEKNKKDANKVSGCQSQVWLYSEFADGKVIYEADSDAVITKGLVGLLVKVLSNHTPQEIINAELDFIDRIGMKEHLSPNRSNGLVSMIQHMKKSAEFYLNRN